MSLDPEHSPEFKKFLKIHPRLTDKIAVISMMSKIPIKEDLSNILANF